MYVYVRNSPALTSSWVRAARSYQDCLDLGTRFLVFSKCHFHCSVNAEKVELVSRVGLLDKFVDFGKRVWVADVNDFNLSMEPSVRCGKAESVAR